MIAWLSMMRRWCCAIYILCMSGIELLCIAIDRDVVYAECLCLNVTSISPGLPYFSVDGAGLHERCAAAV